MILFGPKCPVPDKKHISPLKHVHMRKKKVSNTFFWQKNTHEKAKIMHFYFLEKKGKVNSKAPIINA